MILDVLGVVLFGLGTLFVVVSGLGMLRFPDPLMRLHASTKAGTLGVAFIVSGMMCFYPSLSTATRGTALIVFLLLTAPVAAHMIGRASYYGGASMNVSLWEGTIIDEMQESLGPGEGGAASAG
ncbi:MAG: monovalent cation/H(+) antiporter subunit G [Salinivenus sp.]